MSRTVGLIARALPALVLVGCARGAEPNPRQPAESAPASPTETVIARVDFDAMLPESFAVSPDGRQVAYSARYRDGHRVFLGLEVAGPYEQLQDAPPVFSPDGLRLAYVAEIAGERYVILDGSRIGPHQDIGVPVFSPDSSQLAFVVRVGEGQAVVVGAETMAGHDQVDDLR